MAHKFGDNWKKAQKVGNEIGEKIDLCRGYR